MLNFTLFGIDLSGILYGALLIGAIVLIDLIIHKGKNPYINYDYKEDNKNK